MFSTFYNDWICKTVHGNTLDGYTEVSVKDMAGNWKVVRRFDEAGDFMSTDVLDYVSQLLYNGQPVSH